VPVVGDETGVVTQNPPTLRVQIPSASAIGVQHKDSDYERHVDTEINIWVPVTDVWGDNTLHTVLPRARRPAPPREVRADAPRALPGVGARPGRLPSARVLVRPVRPLLGQPVPALHRPQQVAFSGSARSTLKRARSVWRGVTSVRIKSSYKRVRPQHGLDAGVVRLPRSAALALHGRLQGLHRGLPHPGVPGA